MKKLLTSLSLLLVIGVTQAQKRDYQYFAVGSSYATIPHTNTFTPNILIQGGIVYDIWDVSINVEWVDLEPNYLSYYAQVQVIPFDEIIGIEAFIGAKYGRIIRSSPQKGNYSYAGVNGELRYGKKFFISLQGSYDYRADIRYWYGKGYMVYTTHLKIGIKL